MIDQRISKGKAFFNWCVREGFLESNPMGAIKRPKKNWQPDPLCEDEVTMLIDSTRHSWASASTFGPIPTRCGTPLR